MKTDKSKNVLKGIIGEDLAMEYLISNGYKIEQINWRSKKAEIDLIAKDGNVLVFVEVKLRSTSLFGNPERSVGAKKKKLLVAAATSYMDSIEYEMAIRFDIITIIYRSNNDFSLEHYKDAFFPGI